MTQIRAEENWWMPGESYSTKNAKLVSNTFKYNFMIYIYCIVYNIVEDHSDIKRLASLPCNSNTLMIYLSVN